MRHVIAFLVCGVLFPAGLCLAQDKPESVEADRRLEYMQRMIEAMELTFADGVANEQDDQGRSQRFAKQPILRFGDRTRDAADGAIWKLGTGRSMVIVGMEFCRNEGEKLQLNHEFLCLTDDKLELRTGKGWKWTPQESALRFQKLDDRAPHTDERIRIAQMKKLARRFTAAETYGGETYRLRLMAQPIDRYTVEEEESKQHGAIFAFANGTNPEVLLFVETRPNGWQFGLARMCGAQATVKLDGKEVWTVPSMDDVQKSWSAGYTGDAHDVDLPED